MTPLDALIIGAVRSPIGKAGGALAGKRPDDLATEGVDLAANEAPQRVLEAATRGCRSVAG